MSKIDEIEEALRMSQPNEMHSHCADDMRKKGFIRHGKATTHLRELREAVDVEALREAVSCGKHPDQARDFKKKYGEPYFLTTRSAAKALLEFLEGN